jgi:hypothetical protein
MKLKGKWKTDIKMGITCWDRCHKKRRNYGRIGGLGRGGGDGEIWTGLVDR